MPREEASTFHLSGWCSIWRFKFWGENLLGAEAVENELSTLDSSVLITFGKRQRKTRQIAQIRHFAPQKFCKEQPV